MCELKFSRDEDGAACAQATDENLHMEALAAFLESDIQDDPETCGELIEALKELDPKAEEAFEVVGNSYSVTFDGDTVTFDCLPCESDDLFMLPIKTVTDGLKAWQDFISQ